MKKKSIALALALSMSLSAFCSCGGSKDKADESADNKATSDVASSDVASADVATSENSGKPIPDGTTPSPTPTPSYEETWKYQIVQKGYYNAAATWDEEGNLLAGPTYEPGSQVYYNDCDEYYDNFVSDVNIFGDADLTLDDAYAHSCDNSVKITGRTQENRGLSGFALRFCEENVLDLSKLKGKQVTLGLWVYYADDILNSVDPEMTFAVWSNLDPDNERKNEILTEEPEYIEITDNMSDEEKSEAESTNYHLRSWYDRRNREEELAHDRAFTKLTEVTVPYKTWKYIEVTTTVNTDDPYAMLAVSTLGETNSENVSFYNPFYVDDIILTIN